jgi:hypothetical protein
MVLAMKETMNMEKNMEPVLSNGLMDLCTLENFITTTFMVKESTLGQMVANMKENGEVIKCTERAHSLGQMAGSMLVNMLMIKNKVMVNLFGLMADPTKETGSMVNSMEKVFTSLPKVLKNTESGKKEKESDGSAKTRTIEVNVYNP